MGDDERRQGPLDLGSAIDAYMGSVSSQEALTQRTMALWCQAAGEIGARHTRGVFLRESATGLPTLIVYLDSSPLIYEYTTDMGLYRDRLALLGMGVASLEFRLSRYTGQERSGERVAQGAQAGWDGQDGRDGHATWNAKAGQMTQTAQTAQDARDAHASRAATAGRISQAFQDRPGERGEAAKAHGDTGEVDGAREGESEVDESLVEGLPERLARAILGAMRASEHS